MCSRCCSTPGRRRQSHESTADPRRSPDPAAGGARNHRARTQLDLVSVGATPRRGRGDAGGAPERARRTAADRYGSAAAPVYPDGLHGSATALSPGMVDDTAGVGGSGDRGLSLSPGTFFLLSPYLAHHDARFFPSRRRSSPTDGRHTQSLAPPGMPISRLAGGRASVLAKGSHGWKAFWCWRHWPRRGACSWSPASVEPWGLVTLRPKQGIPLHLARRGPRGTTHPGATAPEEEEG